MGEGGRGRKVMVGCGGWVWAERESAHPDEHQPDHLAHGAAPPRDVHVQGALRVAVARRENDLRMHLARAGGGAQIPLKVRLCEEE